MRFLLTLILALSLSGQIPTSAHSGVLKWAAGGAAACTVSGVCGKLAAQGSLKAGKFLARRYGEALVRKCLASSSCMSHATSAMKAIAAGAAVGTATRALDAWMSDQDGGDELLQSDRSGNANSSTASPDPDEPPEGDDRDDNEEHQPNLGNKIDFVLGRATGRAHNIQRSRSMLASLNRIGLQDNAATRRLLEENITAAYRDPSSIVSSTVDGWIERESLLMGPGGGVKITTQWKGRDLISAIVEGAKLKGPPSWTP